MIRVGFLFGQERDFPYTVIDRINQLGKGEIVAEPIRLGGTRTDDPIPYKVILDRISHEVYYYRSYCKKAVADGAVVINNPFWWSADDKFFENVLAQKLGVAIPKTIVLPSKNYPVGIVSESLHNLEFPLPWEEMVAYTGFPAVLKPAIGGGNKNVHIVNNLDELIQAFDSSGDLLMVLQECIQYENYVRCWVFGREFVYITRYDHRRHHMDRYVEGYEGITPELRDRVTQDCLTLNQALGYDMNTVEFAIRDGIPYAIDFLNPAPDCDPSRIGQQRFEWVVETMTDLILSYARGEREPAVASPWRSIVGVAGTPKARKRRVTKKETVATAEGGPA